MKKRNLILSLTLGTFLINLVSAYGGFSVSDFLDQISPSNLVLPALFIIFFSFINFSLSKIFKDNRMAAGISSLAISILIIYGLNHLDFNLDNIFYNIGIPSDVLTILVPLIFIGGVIFLVSKYKLATTFIVVGLFFLAVTVFTDIIYESEFFGVLGAILLVAGAIMKVKVEKKDIEDFL